MSKPQPKPIDPAQLITLAHATILAAKFPCLASIDGDQPRLRPVPPVRTDGFSVYVANLRPYQEEKEPPARCGQHVGNATVGFSPHFLSPRREEGYRRQPTLNLNQPFPHL